MAAHRPAGNVPASTTAFIGRARELAQIRQMLSVSRLVTLTGVGGVGKTRLAVRIAGEAWRAFPDGAWLVDLAALDDPALVAQTVASVLGVRDQSARWPVAVLSDHLCDRNLLLVLDNCEHLLDACAVLADALLGAAPDLRILATSRQPLGLPSEQTVVVPPLAVPDPHGDGSAEALAGYDAVNLFVTRAAGVVPGFQLTERNAAAVAALCTRLDGLPLAIELAAARLRALSPEQVLSRLDERFALLTGGSRVARPRQQTLRALVAWSYELCSAEERALWALVSVFVGSFDLEAAEHVCADERLRRGSLLDLVAGLVEKSVLMREEHDSGVRYRLLDTIREYGRERLAEGGDETALRRRHRDYYLELALRASSGWFSAQGPLWRERMRLEHPNLRAALDFSLSGPGEAETGMYLAAVVGFFWRVSGLLSEGRRWLDRLLALGAEPTLPRAYALWANGMLAVLQNDVPTARSLLDEGLSLARQFGDAPAQAYATLFSGHLALVEGDLVAAADLLEQARAAHLAMENPLGVGFALFWGSLTASALGDAERATRMAAEYLALCEAHGAHWLTGFGHLALALELWQRGETAAAADQARETVRNHWDNADLIGIAQGAEVLAWVAVADGRAERAARLLGLLDKMWHAAGGPLVGFPHLAPYHEACVARTRDALGEQEFARATEQGSRLTVQETISYVLEERAPKAVRPSAGSSPLTRREQEVAELVAAGSSNKEIASTLVISQRTAETHVEHILVKLGFTARAQIATWVTARKAERR
jgi:predicted ATPase/DNA-binding CsgD family transcriptional regulator